MIGTLKHDDAAGWIVEYQHQLTISCTQRKEIQLHPDDVYLTESLSRNQEVSFYIVENQKMSGVVQYAKLIRESHSDQIIDIMNDEKSLEISDEEILDAAARCRFNSDVDISIGSFELGARWYREQLKLKQ